MGWSCRNNGRQKTGKGCRYLESGGEKEGRKTEVQRGIALSVT